MNPVCQIHVRLKCAKTEVEWPRKLDVIKYSSVIQVQRLLARAISTRMQTHTCITHAQQLIEDVGDKVYWPANHNNVPFFIVLGRHHSAESCSTTQRALTGRQRCNLLVSMLGLEVI